MFIKNYQLIFIFMLMMGSMIAVSANSWFTCWMGLEINLMSMTPLMLIYINFSLTEAAIKYFLTQAMGSTLLMYSSLMCLFQSVTLNFEIYNIILMISILMKTGMAPFHFWFPQVTNLLNWNQCLILFTWQKLAPIILLSSLNFNFLLATSVLSSFAGAMGGLNQNSTKIIMSYSSIAHSSWMILAAAMKFSSWLLYFSAYSFLSLAIVSFFKSNKNKFFKNIFFNKEKPVFKIILVINMLSLGGIPPLLGFTAKVVIILTSIKFKIFFIFIPLILSSVISLFFYVRIIYTAVLNFNKTMNLNFKTTKKSNHSLFFLSMILNIFSPLSFLVT